MNQDADLLVKKAKMGLLMGHMSKLAAARLYAQAAAIYLETDLEIALKSAISASNRSKRLTKEWLKGLTPSIDAEKAQKLVTEGDELRKDLRKKINKMHRD